MTALPPPVPPEPGVPIPQFPPETRGGGGITAAIVVALGGGVMFAFAWLIAKWLVNTCPEQGITEDDAHVAAARIIIMIATVAWAAIPMLGARNARRRDRPSRGFVLVACLIVLLGVTTALTLSSGELCLS